MRLKIAILPGDGIGPEVMGQGLATLDAIAKRFGHEFEYNEAPCGAHGIEVAGDPSPTPPSRSAWLPTPCSLPP